ncbi:hypothetical protein DEO72_LG3g1625 [Vigna unguiculata]|uniref:Uncharacterized protein n=1 Tax=Vigna unguiculata TaxID=3917 RepID=A0A4D6LF39_VIGUN|nr:hypothetical protein DEO72_LG3g1625 [Vigna unguiculata]
MASPCSSSVSPLSCCARVFGIEFVSGCFASSFQVRTVADTDSLTQASLTRPGKIIVAVTFLSAPKIRSARVRFLSLSSWFEVVSYSSSSVSPLSCCARVFGIEFVSGCFASSFQVRTVADTDSLTQASLTRPGKMCRGSPRASCASGCPGDQSVF